MYSVCFAKHILECGVIVLYVLEEPLLGELRGREAFFGGVHRLATALKEVEEVREEVQEIKDEWEDEEVEENGGLKVEENRSSHAWMR